MIRETQLIAGAAIGVLAAILIFRSAGRGRNLFAGDGEGPRAADPATATTRAQHELIQQAARLGGKLSQQSTNCKKSTPALSAR